MDEMDVSDALREFVVADIVGGQYQCDGCFPDGCGPNAAEHILSDGAHGTRRASEPRTRGINPSHASA